MKAIIIEDEQLVARALQAKVTAIEPSIRIMAILPSLKTARRWLMENAEPDLMFMDIQLGDGISFKLFDEFDLKCPVIFTTAYNEYAINAFKANGIDYLLKPIEENELRRAIEKSITLNNKLNLAPADILRLIESVRAGNKSALYKEKFLVNVKRQMVPVNTTHVAFFYKESLHYLHTLSGDQHILEFTSLEEIEELLDPNQYYRANRQYIVNIDAISSIELHENQKLTLKLKPPLKATIDVSREKAPAFKKWFNR
ncbi:LytTR family DNA-binding domain-containing protein [Terrimonas sp. NA20]|uniref:LytTR family DNA-binding domain-containing protein n=1 Tax=Terrimonas ginsenosidimutans TaxID=2908004 RepID=A0ABS9KM05_9BACT|nr:LytTR family DNA-binding domain-containing protein [Terrimonas ginsenosidimutans]MCG2613358.1 LytTR family DNA-binding domain-containing protein [Terrimonas ginsenosidimutans]